MQAPWQQADAEMWEGIGWKHSIKHPAGTDFVTGGGAAVWKCRNTRIERRERERMESVSLFLVVLWPFNHSVKGCRSNFPSETMHAEHQEACMQAKMTTCWFIGTQMDRCWKKRKEWKEKKRSNPRFPFKLIFPRLRINNYWRAWSEWRETWKGSKKWKGRLVLLMGERHSPI